MREIEVLNWREKPGGYRPRRGDRVEIYGRGCGVIQKICHDYATVLMEESGKLRTWPLNHLAYAPSESQIQALCEQRQQEWTPAEHLSRWQGPPQHVPAEIQEVPDVGFTCEYLNA